MKTLLIGRDHQRVDIAVNDETVSRLHAEIILSENGKIYLADRNSTNEVFVYSKNRWEKHSKGYVDLTDKIRLGDYETNISDLVGDYLIKNKEDDNSIGKPRFDPNTGEIIYE